jgi:hypothetical protein
MLNRLFSLIGKSIAPSGKGVVSAVFSREITGNLPYGTVINTFQEPLVLNWSNDESPWTSGNFQWGYFPYYEKADGAGGTFLDFTSGYSLGVETATLNQVIEDDPVNHPLYRVLYKGGSGFSSPSAGTWNQCRRIAATGNGTSGTLYTYISEAMNEYPNGSYNTTEYYDGFCGTTTETVNSWNPYGTLIVSYGDYNYLSDGMGGYYSESISPSYPSYGTFLYGDGSSNTLTWYAPNGSSGTWDYGYYGCSYYADGMGGSYSSCGGYTASYGTQITSGSYESSGYDEYGNYYSNWVSYTIYFDGSSGYYTSY